MPLKNKIKFEVSIKIDEIYYILSALPPTRNLGILGGELGKALFYLYYSQYKNDHKALEQAAEIIVSATRNLPDLSKEDVSLSRGLISLAWLIAHIERHKLFNTNSTKLLNQLDLILFSKAILDFEIGRYDYLHGSLSVGNYFLNRKRTKKTLSI